MLIGGTLRDSSAADGGVVKKVEVEIAHEREAIVRRVGNVGKGAAGQYQQRRTDDQPDGQFHDIVIEQRIRGAVTWSQIAASVSRTTTAADVRSPGPKTM